MASFAIASPIEETVTQQSKDDLMSLGKRQGCGDVQRSSGADLLELADYLLNSPSSRSANATATLVETWLSIRSATKGAAEPICAVALSHTGFRAMATRASVKDVGAVRCGGRSVGDLRTDVSTQIFSWVSNNPASRVEVRLYHTSIYFQFHQRRLGHGNLSSHI